MAEGSPVEMKAHEQTYDSFIRLFKYGTLVCLVVAFIVVCLIAS
jgi:hypothetical protein